MKSLVPASGNLKALYVSAVIFVLLFADYVPAKILLSSEAYSIYFGLSILAKLTLVFSFMLTYGIQSVFSRSHTLKKKFSYHFFLTFIFQWLIFVLLGMESQYTVTRLFGEQFLPLVPYLPYYTFTLLCVSLFYVYKTYFTTNFLREAKRFFIPKRSSATISKNLYHEKRIAVVIPTYIPTIATVRLIQSIMWWHPQITIVVVDDSTPLTEANIPIINRIKTLAYENVNVVYFRSSEKKLKAGALNYGIDYLRLLPHDKPEVVFTFDDDVIIGAQTIPSMVNTLFSGDAIGAVCSQVRIINKNKNILTRMQALEYHSFNITKIADNGFLKGPLVMQGMLTAVRIEVLEQINGFTTGHLIEDYEMTVRSKIQGWEVRIAQNAVAWTSVPETISSLWKQRARWISGGISVLLQFWKSLPAIYQDLYGHSSFLGLLLLIALSFRYAESYTETAYLTPTLLALSLGNFFLTLVYNAATLFEYPDKDKLDWFLKLTVLPDFIYSNMLSVILIGAYAFFLYNLIISSVLSVIAYIHKVSLSAFSRAGYSTTAWGTR